jgi:hypothetical protein
VATEGEGNARDGRTWAKVGAKLKGLSNAKKTLETENGTLKTSVSTLTAENAELKKQVSTPDAKDKKIAELTATIRTTKHKGRFAELAAEAGVNPDAVEALYKLSGYEPKADDVDDAALKALLETAKTEHKFAFVKGEPAKEGEGAPPAPKPIPGQGRGAGHDGKDGTIITAEQRMDPKFMLNRANQDVILAAAKEHRFR